MRLGATSMLARVELRRAWRTLLALGVLAGITLGIALAATPNPISPATMRLRLGWRSANGDSSGIATKDMAAMDTPNTARSCAPPDCAIHQGRATWPTIIDSRVSASLARSQRKDPPGIGLLRNVGRGILPC